MKHNTTKAINNLQVFIKFYHSMEGKGRCDIFTAVGRCASYLVTSELKTNELATKNLHQLRMPKCQVSSDFST